MRFVPIFLKFLAQAALFFLMFPVQLLAIRHEWRIAGWLPVIFHRLFLRMFKVRILVRGTPPGREPTLVLANHTSWLDITVLGSLGPLSFVAKSEVAGWPVVGLFARCQRSVFIERARRSHTGKVNAVIARRLARGDAMVLFAEGTTSDGNRVLPFRPALVGAARAALAHPAVDRIWLQPLAITYVRRNGVPITRRERPEVAWYGDMDLVPHLVSFLKQAPLDAVVAWGEPIAFGAGTDRKEATAQAERAVRAALHRVRLGPGADATEFKVPSSRQTA
jgi:lyso-ornithine lipid O-acyltransferase